MSPALKLDNIIPHLLEYFPFEKYLSHLGYVRNEASDTKPFRAYVKNAKNKVKDIVFVSFIEGSYYYYSFHTKDHGDSITFVKNRIDKTDASANSTPLVIACKNMMIFMKEEGAKNEQAIEQENKVDRNELFNFLQNPFTSYYKLNQLHDYSYFKSLGIDDKTVDHNLFSGTIFNSTGIDIGGKTLNLTNTCFIMHDTDEKECGINYSNFLHDEENNTKQEINIYSLFTNKNRGLWFSNTLSFTKGRNRSEAILVNHPAEAVAHFYIHQNLANYFAYFETISEDNIVAIQKHVKKNNQKLTIATPNTKEAYLDDIKLYLAFIKDENITFSSLHEQIVTLRISRYLTNKEKLVKLIKSIDKLNHAFTKKNISLLGDSAKKYLKKEIIHKGSVNDNIEVKIPYTFYHLSNFADILSKTYPSEYISKFDKTEYLHWRNASQEYTKSIDKKFAKFQELIFS